MAVTTADSFLAVLEKSRLISPEALAQVRTQSESDPQAIAQALIAQGHLSRWQAQQVLAGRHTFFLGKYKLLDKLGEGGMGAVYKARQTTTGRLVALKVMSENVVKQPGAVSRFHREIRAVAALQHPNIVAAFDADQVGETHFLVMEYAEGRDLKEWIKEFGRLPNDWSCECIRQAALGLQHAHEKGLAHRDIKPSNMLVVDGECTPHAPREEKDLTRSVRSTLVVKILDMGLARFTSETQCTVLTQTGQVLGTIDYISPEQAKDTRGAGIQADIFSLGASLYHMLCGQVPYTGKNPMEKLMARAMRDAPRASTLRPDIPVELDAIIARMLARKADDRFQTPDEVVQVLTPYCLGASSEQCTPHAPREETGLTRSVRSTLGPIEAEADATLNQFLNVLGEEAAAEPASKGNEVARPASNRPLRVKWIAAAVLVVLAVGIGIAWRFSGGIQVSSVPKSATYPPIDLLKLIDPQRDAVQGEWKFEGDKLVTPGAKDSRLLIPIRPPDEYNLAIQAERQSDRDGLFLGVLAGGRQTVIILDGFGRTCNGLHTLDGKGANQNESTTRADVFPMGKLISINCEIRKTGIRVSSETTKFIDWKGDLMRLSRPDHWSVRDPSVLFLVSHESFTIYSATLTPISGPAEIVIPESPVDEAFIKQVAALPPQEQIRLVVEKLKAINPGFDGTVQTALDKDGKFVEFFRLVENKAVKDISPVRALVRLSSVDIHGTPITSLEPLRGMKLTRLSCYDTRITSLTPLSGMPLTTLACYRTPISSLEPLRGMKLTNLHLGATRVSDLGPLAGMPLTTLEFSFNPITSLAPLSGMPLTSLGCINTPITSLEPLRGMKLTTLDLGGTQVSDLGPLAGMPLTDLRCYGTPITNLEPLRGMKLKHLNLGGVQAPDLGPLSGMPLTSLTCNHMPIANLEPLRGMPLASLTCHNTPITSLEPLRGMKLTTLDLGGTQVSDLEPLAGMPLTQLKCDAPLARKHADLLKSMKTLVRINDLPVADFWKKVEIGPGEIVPPDQPPPAKAPFDAKQARSHQEAWAKHLETAVERTNSIGMHLVLIPPGEFLMGTPQANVDRLREQYKTNGGFVERVRHEVPEHRVRITRPFQLGKHEVTQGQYEQVMGTNPSQFKDQGLRAPVEQVSWYDAVSFCNKLSESEKLPAYYRIAGDNLTVAGGTGYRLPTEAEWEYACRAGTTGQWSSGDDPLNLRDYGWFHETAVGKTHPVGEKAANGFGLCDMHGNVWEWCWNRDGKYESTAFESDPIGSPSGVSRVYRGGSWNDPVFYGRSAFRIWAAPKFRNFSVGFRVAVSPSGK